LELRQLETFARVAQLHSFTRAAEELALTQPAVTRQIAALERELHTRLLERMGRRVQLTAAGEALYAYAVQMLRLAREAERAEVAPLSHHARQKPQTHRERDAGDRGAPDGQAPRPGRGLSGDPVQPQLPCDGDHQLHGERRHTRV